MGTKLTQSPLQTDYAHVYSVWTLPNPDEVTDYGMLPYIHTDSYQCIQDDNRNTYVDYYDGTRRRKWKPVDHLRWSLQVDHTPVIISETPTDYWATNWAKMLSGAWNGNDLGFSAWSEIRKALPAIDTGHYDRWQAVKPSMSTRLNLSVSLMELMDIKKLWDILPNKHFRLKDWHSVLHYANGLHLNYNFGWKPFLGDVLGVLETLNTFEARLSRLLREQNRPLRKRFSESGTKVESLWSTPVPNTPRTIEYDLSAQANFTSCFDFTYSLPDYKMQELRNRAWLDALGLHATIGNLWQILPWSFVVDWFVDVGGMLDTFQSDWVQPWLMFHQSCYSRKVYGSCRISISHRALSGAVYKGTPVTLDFSHYSRCLGLPTFQVGDPNLDADKIRLGASLALSLTS